MKALLDTHAFLWWITDDSRLSQAAREFIANPENELFLSAASGWEMAIKTGLGRLEVAEPLTEFIPRALSDNSIQSLPIQMIHTLSVGKLPPLHRDPFDRLLIAQAQVEDIPILTIDEQIVRYAVEVIW